MTSQTLERTLAGVSLFSELETDDLRRLAALGDVRTYDREEVILHQEEPGDALYSILAGRVKVVLYSDDGKEVILSTLREGDFFGEMALIDGGPRSASVVALESSRLFRLRRRSFLDFIKKHPDLSLRILEAMSLRLRMADGKIGSLALMDVYGRVARALRELAVQEGKQVGRDVVIERRPSHQELAAMVGTTRETVSRVLGDFVRSELVEFDSQKRLVLHNEFLEE